MIFSFAMKTAVAAHVAPFVCLFLYVVIGYPSPNAWATPYGIQEVLATHFHRVKSYTSIWKSIKFWSFFCAKSQNLPLALTIRVATKRPFSLFLALNVVALSPSVLALSPNVVPVSSNVVPISWNVLALSKKTGS